MTTATLTRPPRLARLHEHVATAGRVDREAGIIRGVKVLGRVSTNGYEYSDKALDDAARLHEGARVRLNHPRDRDDGDESRGLADEFGQLKNVRRKGDAIFGDLHYIKTHPMAEFIVERAERFPDKIGLSHYVEARVVRRGGREVVEEIGRVYSVDLVNNPATNKGLFESRQQGSGYPATVQEFARRLTGRGLWEDTNNAGVAMPMDDQPMSQSQDVDDAVLATLGERLPAQTVTELRRQASNALARVYESAVVVVTKSADNAPDDVDVKAMLAALLEEKQRAMDALDAILLPLDSEAQYDAEVDVAREKEGLPPLDGETAETIESLNRRLDAIQHRLQEGCQRQSRRPIPSSADGVSYRDDDSLTYDELRQNDIARRKAMVRDLR